MLSQPLFAVAAIAAVHIFAAYSPFAPLKRGGWHAFASGAAAAYVFLHVLPLLNSMSSGLTDDDAFWPGGEWVFVAALAGTCAFLAIESYTRPEGRARGSVDTPRRERLDFWLHVAAFALYNLLVGYMLVENPYGGLLDTLLYQAALVLHFAAIDQASRERHQALHDRIGRWIMAAAVVIGWGIGQFGIDNVHLAGLAFAFLAGGMILNVLKEELATVGPARLAPFLGGATIFAGILLIARANIAQ